MSGKNVLERGLALIESTGFSKFCFRVLRRDFNAQFLDLFIGNAGHAAAGNQQIAIAISGIDQAQNTVANTTDNRCLRVLSLGDLLRQYR